MGTHGRDFLIGRILDKKKAEKIRIILFGTNPYKWENKPEYKQEADEIAEQIEGNSYSLSTIELIIQVTLYRWGLREYLDGADLKLAREIQKIYEN